ncbi:hypothetical protein LTR56_020081 [Elasticomyces elasticus]|uniref:Uncharacterized protein n=1 Tax=Elasticomyces elasticus TaxID=574655 RepID=A0AAN8A5M3_9PEZI|nr:hypothetical protein LTR56_020081 [Elasticomyces elasticus]KAK3633844.1 hypothetical protein LTR22_019919 [Elasticomyces elasticus]KAK4910952.1 hypothetical protein LTR49_020397 [Elasticomyces elasticus]KAK5706029.1 hypothetical protein LTR97_001015 [Elasticomyces elasticus]KAK5723813.1 hypothetical protein LTR15_005513 [Elasticomyces elasticus]
MSMLKPLSAIAGLAAISGSLVYFMTAPRQTLNNHNGLGMETTASSAIASRFSNFEDRAARYNISLVANEVRAEEHAKALKRSKAHGV